MKLHPRLTPEGVVLAQRGERLRTVAERDAAGWVVGYGHRASAREGARVDADDAAALLVYDLSRSAGEVEPRLSRPAPPALFDALNAYAWRVGPAAFARSELLRRHNAGEALAPEEVTAARDAAAEAPSSAVLAAADAVRDRVSQVLDAPPRPAPARPARAPWPEPTRPPDAPDLPGGLAAPHPDATTATSDVATAGEEEPPPPPFIAPSAEPLGEPPHAPADDAAGAAAPPIFAEPPAAEPEAASAARRAPVVSFERGGRARLWARLRGDPRVYAAVGACGLALFLSALAGVLLEHPTPLGIALGVAGVLCLAPAVAFFLGRRGAGG